MYITESVSASGNCVTFEGSGKILCRVKELVTIKLGGDGSTINILSSLVTIATAVAVATIPGAGAIGAAASIGGKVAFKVAGGIAQQATNQLMKSTPYNEISENITMHEFKHKYLNSKSRPITLRLEFSRELANQYLNKRELKGKMLYTYSNFKNLGETLAQGGFFKASVITWNMTRNSDWWREKIESGVYLYEDNSLDFYTINLTKGLNATESGGVNRTTWDEFITVKNFGVKGGKDDISDKGRGFWVKKSNHGQPNYIRPKGTDHDFLPEIIRELGENFPGLIVDEDSGKWILDWKTEFSGDKAFKWNVPENYKFAKAGSCSMEFRLLFFSNKADDESARSLEGEEFNVTHILISKTTSGTRSDLLFNFVGEHKVKNRGSQDPASIPPSKQLPIDPFQTNPPSTIAFNPNQFSSSGNLVATPTGSGEPEISIPAPDFSPDPDKSPDFGVDPDPTVDPDPPPDQDPPPDEDPPPDTD